jgi:tRNA G18 (ribose-2'-O)-methylase SpoU
MEKRREVYLVLDNIRSVHNVGSIFRTADAAGVAGIFLCGLTPQPVDRFGNLRQDLAKVALGAERTVSWKYFQKTNEAVRFLKRGGCWIIAVEQTGNSLDYKKVKLKKKTAFVFGNELNGVSAEVLKESDLVAEIPMAGRKESLNVSVSAGVVLFRALNL